MIHGEGIKMKKITLILTVAAAMALTACGGKNAENVQTEAAATSQAAEETTAEAVGDYTAVPLPEDYEQAFYEGLVTDYVGSYMTVSGADGEKKFDLNGADMSELDEPVIRGCYVEITYADAAENGTYPADGFALLNDNEQLAQEQDRDPYIYGKLQVIDINELEIVDDAGRTIDFDNSISRTVSFAELKPGDDVVITYAGSVVKNDDGSGDSTGIFGDIPVAIKIVAQDAVKTEDAEANYIDGTVSVIDGDTLTLSTALSDFDCRADASMLADVKEETHVRVYYTGALSDIVLVAEKIESID